MANKRVRQATVRELIEAREVGSQEELRKLLRQRGWDVTQATLSRDLRELGVARVSTPEGPRYTLAAGSAAGSDGNPVLEAVLPPLFNSVDGVGEMVVIRNRSRRRADIERAIDASGPGPTSSAPSPAGHHPADLPVDGGRERLVRRIRSLAGR